MGLCCRQNKNLSFDANSLKNPSLFVGDSIMKKQNFFINIASKKGTSILKNINKKYLKNFSKFYKSNLKLSKFENITIKVVKQSSSNLNEIKVNFFTYKNDKKVDSIQFYRNIEGDGYGTYNCLSYYDSKKNKIWQLEYFPVTPNPKGDSPGIISFSKMSINSEGKIKSDSLFYLDEYLEVERGNYGLYY